MDLTLVLFWLISIIGSGIFHEQWHARVAYWLGDPTGKHDRRLSWNPIHHIDLWMTILLPIMILAASGGKRAFGGMKPVRINAMNFRNPALGMALSAGAGPLSNFVLAIGGMLLLWAVALVAPDFLYGTDGSGLPKVTFNGLFLGIFILTNVLLGSFNLLPLPGLDGSRILYFFLPREGRAFMDRIEPFALLITMVLVFQGIGAILSPVFALCLKTMAATAGDAYTLAFWARIR